MPPFLRGSLLGLAGLLLATALSAEELKGRVVGITDGDTLTLLTRDLQQKKVRLADIDTPERGQPYGRKARQALADLAYRKQVAVIVEDTDRYGRAIGQVYAGERKLNLDMVRRGAAWVDRRYTDDPALVRAQAEARAAKRGLWALPEADRTPPWEWRRQPAAERRREASPPRQRRPPARVPAPG
ncbi:thermonuclease family protein [Roseicella aerolata]|uniref:Thermonuclease family protein n=1 Tax=Roseicella aerolata TaxID=2883479 RepID=A0A9X1IJZ6_9PROT|nr:thermonuclease family protein [Roseicella aerolata]MCB4824450.1 thermonuclease family protein [Roseicella aerolata]